MTQREKQLADLKKEADRDISIASLFKAEPDRLDRFVTVSYTHLTLPTIYSV